MSKIFSRSLCFILTVVAGLTACKSKKEVLVDSNVSVDSASASNLVLSSSLSGSEHHSFDFSFDSIEVRIERQTSEALMPEVVKMKVTNGRIIDRKDSQRDSVAVYNSVDSVAFKVSAATSSAEHSASTRVYSPPNATILIFLAAICVVVLIWLRFR